MSVHQVFSVYIVRHASIFPVSLIVSLTRGGVLNREWQVKCLWGCGRVQALRNACLRCNRSVVSLEHDQRPIQTVARKARLYV